MTRSSKLALVTLLAGLLSLASVGTVSAAAPCAGIALERCEQLAAAVVFRSGGAPYLGVAREQFEGMQAGQFAAFGLGSTVPIAAHRPGYAFEQYERLMVLSTSI